MKDKELLREKVWNHLNQNGLTSDGINTGRIPKFNGAMKAAVMLKNTPEWENSQVIFCSPDSAQVKVREYALRDGKQLIMASPKLKEGYLHINPEDAYRHESMAATIKGAFKVASKIKIFPIVELVVEGSVAVDLSGGRLGKGGGYADQEIEHLLLKKAINNKTPIVTTIHEAQIVEKIPLESHDKKINMIVTPERVIRIQCHKIE